MKLRNLLLIPLIFASHLVVAEESTESNTKFGFGLGSYTLNSSAATSQKIEDSMYVINVFAEGYTGIFSYGLGINMGSPDDNDSFQVDVVDSYGKEETASSDVSTRGFYAELGAGHHVNDNVRLEVLGGYEILSGDRSIANCSDCPSQDIDLDGGLYLKPRMKFETDSDYSITVQYQLNMTGDVEGGFMALLGFSMN